jgi:hypothetical protein
MMFPGTRQALVLLAFATSTAVLGPGIARAQEPKGQKQPAAKDAPKSSGEPKRPPVKKAADPGGKAGKAGASGPASKAPAAAPRVLTKAETDARKRRSEFLTMPGAGPQDPYDPEGNDWSLIPAWRQASFFGIRARGQFFVFVLDQSGSMIDDDRLARATIELRRSVFALQPPQRFEVIFYNHEATPMPGGPIPRPADQKQKNLLTTWLRLIEPDGGTDPRRAILQALSLQPDAVFLLSDGEFPEGTAESVARYNLNRKVPVHCVDLSGGLGGDHLRRIARESGGQYASRPGSLQGRP